MTVPDGLNKPYMDLQGRVWVKSGADKRHVTAREEMQRMFQRAGLLQADQVPVRNATAADIDERAFGRYFERRYGQSLDAAGLPVVQLMENLQLAQDGVPNLAGLLLFGKQPQRLLQVCQIGAVWFPGTFLGDTRYLDSENIDGTLEEQFQRGMAFIKRSLHRVQAGRGFNTLGQLEVPEGAGSVAADGFGGRARGEPVSGGGVEGHPRSRTRSYPRSERPIHPASYRASHRASHRASSRVARRYGGRAQPQRTAGAAGAQAP
ncbi:MAG: hypothetical protein U1D25_12305 [Hydrogenophaga sp.]|uniref:hypothetical protein n=1 Tax=Hydrogenophaga sp. TaxID=1904254 RepID=UPI0027647B62|nr:hypothetical protein [Hydrogenophaga sp.]MDP2417821.1 hypothetical protein [Hydrogenophaga sp.]MDZ4188873.1 hypothetical protein [Hydrogenophaga sp.]